MACEERIMHERGRSPSGESGQTFAGGVGDAHSSDDGRDNITRQ